MDLEEHLAAAVAIVQEAGDLITSYIGTDRLDAREKGPRDVVTAADTASEALILRRLRATFPGDGVVAEEGTKVAGSGRRLWYLDPLDGTLNFSRGVPIWCVSLALFEGSVPALGVVHDPVRRETFAAARGLGARCNGSAIQTSGQTNLGEAVVHVTIDFNDASMLEGIEDVQRMAPAVLRTRNIGSAALALAYVAAGRFDGMLHRFAHTWDYGAGVLLVHEAGGSVTDVRGRPYTAHTNAVVAGATSALQADLLGTLDAER